MNAHEYIEKGFGQATLWIDFVNSFESDGLGSSADHLRDPAWRKHFLHHWKLADPSSRAVPLKSLLRLRTLLRRGAEKLAWPEPLRRAELRSLNTAMSVFARLQLFQRQNGFVLEEIPRGRDWGWIQCQIAASFAKTLTGDPLTRVKICLDPLCQWVFYDKTKGTTRLWCNERTCGNRNRVRRARAASKSEN